MQRYENRWRPLSDLEKRIVSMMERSSQFSQGDIQALDGLVQRGLTLHNPKISMSYVREHGHRLTGEDIATALRQFADLHPIPAP